MLWTANNKQYVCFLQKNWNLTFLLVYYEHENNKKVKKLNKLPKCSEVWKSTISSRFGFRLELAGDPINELAFAEGPENWNTLLIIQNQLKWTFQNVSIHSKFKAPTNSEKGHELEINLRLRWHNGNVQSTFSLLLSLQLLDCLRLGFWRLGRKPIRKATFRKLPIHVYL